MWRLVGQTGDVHVRVRRCVCATRHALTYLWCVHCLTTLACLALSSRLACTPAGAPMRPCHDAQAHARRVGLLLRQERGRHTRVQRLAGGFVCLCVCFSLGARGQEGAAGSGWRHNHHQQRRRSHMLCEHGTFGFGLLLCAGSKRCGALHPTPPHTAPGWPGERAASHLQHEPPGQRGHNCTCP